MFSNIFQKAALFGASTIASVALTGMMASSAQAASMSYTTQFNVTSNSLNDAEIVTGDFSYTKTELDSGFFSYELTDFNASVGLFNFSESLTLNDVKANPDPFLVLNEAFIPDKYQSILPSVLASEKSNYLGDGDFGEENLTFTFGLDLGDGNFQADNFDFVFSSEDLDNAGTLASNLVTSIDPDTTKFLMNLALRQGGQINITTQEVPEPTSILGIGMVGIGLTATRRKRASKKIKQKAAA